MRGLKILKTKKGRDETGLFFIEGEKFATEIPINWNVYEYIVSSEFAKSRDLSAYKQRARLEIVRDSIFKSLADTVTPQGIIAVCKQKKYSLKDVFKKDAFLLMGENLNDPGNIGTLIRTATAAGADGFILTKGSGDIYNPKVVRAAAGAVLRLPIVTDVSPKEIIAKLKQAHIKIYAADPRGSVMPYELNMVKNFCLLIGNEACGISDETKGLADVLVGLPMVRSTESLNASVAGGILLFEAVRQRLRV